RHGEVVRSVALVARKHVPAVGEREERAGDAERSREEVEPELDVELRPDTTQPAAGLAALFLSERRQQIGADQELNRLCWSARIVPADSRAAVGEQVFDQQAGIVERLITFVADVDRLIQAANRCLTKGPVDDDTAADLGESILRIPVARHLP